MRTNLHHGEFLLRSELIELAAIATISFHAASRFAERRFPPKVCAITLFIRAWHSFKRILMGDNTSEYFIFEQNGTCLTFVAQNALMKAMNGGKNSYGDLY